MIGHPRDAVRRPLASASRDERSRAAAEFHHVEMEIADARHEEAAIRNKINGLMNRRTKASEALCDAVGPNIPTKVYKVDDGTVVVVQWRDAATTLVECVKLEAESR